MISIRVATVNDVASIVAIHQKAFPDFFLTSLGTDFLILYYNCMCQSDDAITLCAEKDGQVIGFSTCAYVSHGFNKKLIKNNPVRFGLMGVRLLFTQPKAIVRLIKNFDKESSDSEIVDKGEYAELYSIAVSPECQGVGAGKMLLLATEEDVKEHNKAISLTTDYYHNEKTIGFYHSLGYKDFYDFITYPDRRMYRMIKEL